MEEVRVLFIDAAVLTTRRRPSMPITPGINIYGNVQHVCDSQICPQARLSRLGEHPESIRRKIYANYAISRINASMNHQICLACRMRFLISMIYESCLVITVLFVDDRQLGGSLIKSLIMERYCRVVNSIL